MTRLRSLLAALSLAASSGGVALAAASGTSTPDPLVSPPPVGTPGSTAGDIDRLLSAITREEQQAVRRFDELGQRAERAELRALSRGRAYVRLARAGLLPVGSGFATFVEHAARLERLRRGLEKDLSERQRSLRERVTLGQRIEELRARRGPLEAEHEAISRAESALRSAEEREQAFQRAFVGGAANDHTAIYGGLAVDEPDQDPRFVARKGRLPFPLAGRSEVVREKRAASSGPGLAMRARPGAEVRSVHAGHVAFADSVADYGKAVIVDHGEGYFSLSGNLGSIEVAAGDELARGARLGTLGSDPAATLYFEIRNGTQTVDASEWLGL
jgi:murein DD-endopeptidase MepM/ murein hydrolase activator NlpD